MSAAIEIFTVESDTPLDLILWRRYRRRIDGLFEQVLSLNPGLAAQGNLVARGTMITIPIQSPQAPARLPLVRLWG
jgi:phage tail protein X